MTEFELQEIIARSGSELTQVPGQDPEFRIDRTYNWFANVYLYNLLPDADVLYEIKGNMVPKQSADYLPLQIIRHLLFAAEQTAQGKYRKVPKHFAKAAGFMAQYARSFGRQGLEGMPPVVFNSVNIPNASVESLKLLAVTSRKNRQYLRDLRLNIASGLPYAPMRRIGRLRG